MSPLWLNVISDFSLPLGYHLNFWVQMLGETAWHEVNTYPGEGMVKELCFSEHGALPRWCSLPSLLQLPANSYSLFIIQGSPICTAHVALSICCCALGGRCFCMCLISFAVLGIPWGQGSSMTHNDAQKYNNNLRHCYVPGPLLGPFIC